MERAHTRSQGRDRAHSPTESSSDELAAVSDQEEVERRRTSWNRQTNFTPQRPNPKGRQYSESESPDELAVDAEEYWRSSRKRRRRSPFPMDRSGHDARSRSRSELSPGGRMSTDNRAGDRDDLSDRSATPVPIPAPPPKPEQLDYREKFTLRGHLRGVSAVQFSPDCSMIASAGMFAFDLG